MVAWMDGYGADAVADAAVCTIRLVGGWMVVCVEIQWQNIYNSNWTRNLFLI